MTCGVYQIKNILDNKLYIGGHKYIEARIRGHFIMLENNRHFNKNLQLAYNTCGPSCFEVSIIEECDMAITELRKREQYYLDITQCFLPKCGYNISHYSTGVTKDLVLPKEWRANISKGIIKSGNRKGINSWENMTDAEKTLIGNKISVKMTGRKLTKAHIKHSKDANKNRSAKAKKETSIKKSKSKLGNTNGFKKGYIPWNKGKKYRIRVL